RVSTSRRVSTAGAVVPTAGTDLAMLSDNATFERNVWVPTTPRRVQAGGAFGEARRPAMDCPTSDRPCAPFDGFFGPSAHFPITAPHGFNGALVRPRVGRGYRLGTLSVDAQRGNASAHRPSAHPPRAHRDPK